MESPFTASVPDAPRTRPPAEAKLSSAAVPEPQLRRVGETHRDLQRSKWRRDLGPCRGAKSGAKEESYTDCGKNNGDDTSVEPRLVKARPDRQTQEKAELISSAGTPPRREAADTLKRSVRPARGRQEPRSGPNTP